MDEEAVAGLVPKSSAAETSGRGQYRSRPALNSGTLKEVEGTHTKKPRPRPGEPEHGLDL